MNKSIVKIVFTISAVGLLVGFFIVRPAFATSGECSYNGGVDCAAGASANGDAICNDGLISSVPYSETNECSATMSCLSSNQAQQLLTEAENQYSQVIQQTENDEQNAIAQDEQGAQDVPTAENYSCGYSGDYSACIQQYQQQQQEDLQQQILNTKAQFNPTITYEQNLLTQIKLKIQSDECTPQQEVWLGYVSSTDSCLKQNGLDQNCFASGNNSQTSTLSVAAPSLPAPTDLSATAISSSQINLQWSQIFTADNQIAGFKVYRNGLQIATTSYDSYSDMEGIPSTSYSYTIAEYDINGNISPQSSAVTATTLGATVVAPSSIPTSSNNISATITSNLSLGNSGNNVVALQEFLEAKDFLTLPAGISNGYFGNLTKQALITYQSSVGLPDTGYCGPMTRTVINSQ